MSVATEGSEPDEASAVAERLRQLRAEVERIGELSDGVVALPWQGRTYDVTQPRDFGGLLDLAAADSEQQMPYWAEVWPSGVGLADAIARQPERLRGKRVLELGGGLGVTAIAALAAGAALTVADYAAEALLLCRYNALRNAGREPETLRANWRRPEPALAALAADRFPVVLAADVLYEGRDVEPLLGLVERLVAPGGLLWLAEPGRKVAERFLEAAAAIGWRGETDRHPGPWPDPKDDGVVVRLHALRRDG